MNNINGLILGFKKTASGDAIAYKAYFNKKMKEKGIKNPSELGSDEAKKKFFKEVDAGYQGKSEKATV